MLKWDVRIVLADVTVVAITHVKIVAIPPVKILAIYHVKAVVMTPVRGLVKTLVGKVVTYIEYDHYKTKSKLLAVRHGEEHHLHRHQGLPIGLQILLPCGQEREGTDALGSGQDLY